MAHVEASQVVPPLDGSAIQENTYGKATGNVPEENEPENSFKKNNERFVKDFRKIRSQRYRIMD